MNNRNKNKILWLAPNLNHYKLKLLNHLAADSSIDLCVFSGLRDTQNDTSKIRDDFNFKLISVEVSKNDFGNSKLVLTKLKSIFGKFDWIMIPVEKKNIQLFLYALNLRKRHKNTRLFSYNHPILKSRNGKITQLDKWLTKFYYKRLNRIVFYTEQSCKWAIKHGYVNSKKAYWANNTIDSIEIEKYYDFKFPPESQTNLLYIGRLSPRKRIPDVITYYRLLKQLLPNLRLEVVGVGSEDHYIKAAIASDSSIIWHGELINEEDIAPIMKRASIVFVPGHTGLAVNHAFSYGRPYVTLNGVSHAPEVDYIDKGENGYVLNEDLESNIATMETLLSNKSTLERFCSNAYKKGMYLKVQNWVDQMKQNLLND